MSEEKENFEFFIGNSAEEKDPVPFDIKEEADEFENRQKLKPDNSNLKNKATKLKKLVLI